MSLTPSQRRVIHVAFWDIILSRVKEFGPEDTVNYIKQERRNLDSILAGLSRGDKRRFTENLRDSSVAAALQHIQRRSAPDGVGGGAWGDDSFSEAPYDRPASPLTDERDDPLLKERRDATTRKMFDCNNATSKRANDLLDGRSCDECERRAAVCDSSTWSVQCPSCDAQSQERRSVSGLPPSFTRFARDMYSLGVSDYVITEYGKGVITRVRVSGVSSVEVTLDWGGKAVLLASRVTKLSTVVQLLGPNDIVVELNGKIETRLLPEHIDVCMECPQCKRDHHRGLSRWRANSWNDDVEIVIHTVDGPYRCAAALSMRCVEKGCKEVQHVRISSRGKNSLRFFSLSIHSSVSAELLFMFARLNSALKSTLPAEAAYRFCSSLCERAGVSPPPLDDFRAALYSSYLVHAHLCTPTLESISCPRCHPSGPRIFFSDANMKLGVRFVPGRGNNNGDGVQLGPRPILTPLSSVPNEEKIWQRALARSSSQGDESGCVVGGSQASHFKAAQNEGSKKGRLLISGVALMCCDHLYWYAGRALTRGESMDKHIIAALVAAHLRTGGGGRSPPVDTGLASSIPLVTLFVDIACMVLKSLKRLTPLDATEFTAVLWPNMYERAQLETEIIEDKRVVIKVSLYHRAERPPVIIHVQMVVDALHAAAHTCQVVYVRTAVSRVASKQLNSFSRPPTPPT